MCRGKGEFFDPRLIPVKIAPEAVKVALKIAEPEGSFLLNFSIFSGKKNNYILHTLLHTTYNYIVNTILCLSISSKYKP